MLIVRSGVPKPAPIWGMSIYSGPWLAGIRERYARDPQIKYFHTACVADNSAEAVLFPEPAE